MSAFTADVQIYNINYLSNISGALAMLYALCKNVCQRQSAHALQDSTSRSSLIAGQASRKERLTIGLDGPIPLGSILGLPGTRVLAFTFSIASLR
jgi:hypothetical protein